jgi:hypothetical protein
MTTNLTNPASEAMPYGKNTTNAEVIPNAIAFIKCA